MCLQERLGFMKMKRSFSALIELRRVVPGLALVCAALCVSPALADSSRPALIITNKPMPTARTAPQPMSGAPAASTMYSAPVR